MPFLHLIRRMPTLPHANKKCAAQVAQGLLRLLANMTGPCTPTLQLLSPCLTDLGIQSGCCSRQCADAMASVTAACHRAFQRRACADGEIAGPVLGLSERCIGFRTSCAVLLGGGGGLGSDGGDSSGAGDSGAGGSGGPGDTGGGG
jgi:hypothetical protein